MHCPAKNIPDRRNLNKEDGNLGLRNKHIDYMLLSKPGTYKQSPNNVNDLIVLVDMALGKLHTTRTTTTPVVWSLLSISVSNSKQTTMTGQDFSGYSKYSSKAYSKYLIRHLFVSTF